MVAQYDNSPISKVLDVAEDVQRIRAAVDEIADKPQPIGRWVKANVLNEALQGIIASLHIADCIGRHRANASFVSGHSSFGRTGRTNSELIDA